MIECLQYFDFMSFFEFLFVQFGIGGSSPPLFISIFAPRSILAEKVTRLTFRPKAYRQKRLSFSDRREKNKKT